MNELKKYNKKSSIIHPFLFAIFPIMFLYSENIHLLPSTEIILPLQTHLLSNGEGIKRITFIILVLFWFKSIFAKW